MKKMFSILALSATALTLTSPASASDSHGQLPPRQMQWPFEGMLGKVDRQSAQRGFQVYKEVCAACHGLERISFRNLAELGFSEAEVKALAASYTVKDGPNDEGEMYDRPGLASDHFIPPFPNENAARAANNGAYPPDLSLIIKARHDGGNYVYSLLTGYQDPPADVHLSDGQHYNPYFPGGKLAMPAPLTTEGQVSYEDGTKATVDQMSRDVVNFLQWAAEPEMEHRKEMGVKVLTYLLIFAIFLYIAKKRIWARIGHE